MPEPLPADLAAAVSAAAARLGPFGRIEYFSEVGSTNDVALTRAGAGAPHGSVFLAGAQQAGRGRHGRDWFSPPDAGIYMSTIIRRDAWDGALSLVTLAAGVAVAQGLSIATGLQLELKWPNDVVIGRPWRKIAGILSESASVGARVDAIVVGIGVNVRRTAFPADLADRATAIELESDRPVDVSACVVETLAAFADAVRMLSRKDTAGIAAAWRRYGRAGLGGAAVRWNDQQGVRRGIARDVDDSGALVVDSDGRTERLVAGEVFWDRVGRD
jgi:BirA family biotin operon repressor/biotin-[acetyl-CoA-carboxylase] ligase